MFLHILNNDEKILFYHLAKQIVASDNKIEEIEQLTLQYMRSEMNLDDSVDKMQINDIDTRILQVNSYKSKVAILLELIGLCLADEDFADEERKLINKIANNFKISQNQIDSYTNWSNQMLDLTQESRMFFIENLNH